MNNQIIDEAKRYDCGIVWIKRVILQDFDPDFSVYVKSLDGILKPFLFLFFPLNRAQVQFTIEFINQSYWILKTIILFEVLYW